MALPPLKVFRDSAGFPQEAPDTAELTAAQTRTFSEYGGGFIDYSDNNFAAGTTTDLVAGVPHRIELDLSASASNARLNRPFENWRPWDNTAKLVRPRALYDIFGVRINIRIVADTRGGVLNVALRTPTIEIATDTKALVTAGEEERLTANFMQIPVRAGFLRDGASFYLTPNVPMTLIEFSPEFGPDGYEA